LISAAALLVYEAQKHWGARVDLLNRELRQGEQILEVSAQAAKHQMFVAKDLLERDGATAASASRSHGTFAQNLLQVLVAEIPGAVCAALIQPATPNRSLLAGPRCPAGGPQLERASSPASSSAGEGGPVWTGISRSEGIKPDAIYLAVPVSIPEGSQLIVMLTPDEVDRALAQLPQSGMKVVVATADQQIIAYYSDLRESNVDRIADLLPASIVRRKDELQKLPAGRFHLFSGYLVYRSVIPEFEWQVIGLVPVWRLVPVTLSAMSAEIAVVAVLAFLLLSVRESRASEDNLRRVFDASPLPLVLVRVSDATVVVTNRVAMEFFDAADAPDAFDAVRECLIHNVAVRTRLLQDASQHPRWIRSRLRSSHTQTRSAGSSCPATQSVTAAIPLSSLASLISPSAVPPSGRCSRPKKPRRPPTVRNPSFWRS
jgi:hypothetical protein